MKKQACDGWVALRQDGTPILYSFRCEKNSVCREYWDNKKKRGFQAKIAKARIELGWKDEQRQRSNQEVG